MNIFIRDLVNQSRMILTETGNVDSTSSLERKMFYGCFLEQQEHAKKIITAKQF